MATQAHPEFKSRPDRAHPLFRELVAAALERADGREPHLLDLDAVPRPVPGFRRVSEEELLRAWLFRVDRFHLLDPDDEPFDRFVVRHPGAVTVVPVHDDGTVTLVRQYRAAVDDLVLEIPAGTRDQDGRGGRGHGPARAGRGGRPRGGALGAAHRDVELAGDQRPAHPHLFGHRPVLHSEPAPGCGGGVHDLETIHLDDVDALVADGSIKDETTVLGLYMARQACGTGAGCHDGGLAPECRGVPLLARGGAGALSPDPLGLPTRPGVLPGRPREPQHRAGVLRRRGGAPGGVAADPQRLVGGPCALSLRGFHRFLVEEGLRSDDPTARPAVGLRHRHAAEGTERGGDGVAARRRRRDRAHGPARPGGPRSPLRDRRPGQRAGGPDLGDVVAAVEGTDLPLLRVLGKGGRSGSVPIGSLARAALADWLSGEGRPLLEPKTWRSRSDAEAVFLNARGGRLSRVGASAWSRSTPAASAWPTRSARTSCATRVPPTCWGAGPTSGSSRSSWATPPSPPPSATRRSRPSTFDAPTRAPTRGREHRGGGTA